MNIKDLEAVALSIRSLSIDAIQKAKSGHPGLPMGCAELAAVLYGELLKHNPLDSKWIDRDRFILSAGHGSMLLYSVLHLSGYNLSLDDIKNFRQIGSPCPGHPEFGFTDGVEATSGPLGQGIAMAVGQAIAETMLAAKFNTPDYELINHYTYSLVGEGCLMEGVSAEASSLAGHLKLGKLIVFYDENRISIDGCTDETFTEDIAGRYKAYGWQVLSGSMYDMSEIASLVEQAKKDTQHPTLIMLKSVIGKHTPLAGKSSVHGAPVGEDNVAKTKEALGLNPELYFQVVPAATEYFAEKRKMWQKTQKQWDELFAAWSKAFPEKRKEWDQMMNLNVEDGETPVYSTKDNLATRNVTGKMLPDFVKRCPSLVGGSADLEGPNCTKLTEYGIYSSENPLGRTIRFGIREFAMASICAGLTLHGGFRGFCATFTVFSDYMRGAMRMAALMQLPVIYILTHDSIYVGEDGPTHQPVETVACLRAIPGLQVLRPGDAEEAAEAWNMTMQEKNKPVCLVLTRQSLPVYEKDDPDWKNTIKCGAYIVKQGSTNPDITVLATGSEVSMALAAAEKVTNKTVRVVSVLDRELFDSQPQNLQDMIIGKPARVVVTEAGIKMGWEGFATSKDDLFCLEGFGISGPGNKIAEHKGFTAEKLAQFLN